MKNSAEAKLNTADIPSVVKLASSNFGLTEAEGQGVFQHLILAFLGKNGYAAGDYYDAAALGFLQAVQRYLTQPGLRRYAFPTIAWRAMARGVAADYRAEARRRNAEQRYFESAHAAAPCP